MSKPARGVGPSSRTGWLWNALTWVTVDPIKKLAGTALAAVLAYLGYALWGLTDTRIKNYLSDTLVAELKNEKSELVKAIKSISPWCSYP